MTIGAGFSGAIMLGARLRLLALDGATDMTLLPLLLFGGVKFDETVEGSYPDSESLLEEATSAC